MADKLVIVVWLCLVLGLTYALLQDLKRHRRMVSGDFYQRVEK